MGKAFWQVVPAWLWVGAGLLFVALGWYYALATARLWVGLSPDLTVQMVKPGGPGAQAGLQVSDRLVALEGVALHSPADVESFYRAHRQGEPVAVTVERGGEVVHLTARLGGMPLSFPALAALAVGLIHAGVGWWLFARDPGDKGRWYFCVYGLLAMLALGLQGTIWPPAVVVRIGAVALCSGVAFLFAAHFPMERRWARKAVPWAYGPGLVLLAWGVGAYWSQVRQGVGLCQAGLLGTPEQGAIFGNLVSGVAAAALWVDLYRRTTDPIVRRQVHWLVSAVVLSAVALGAERLILRVLEPVAYRSGVTAVTTVVLPVAVAVAAQRYRLAQIDDLLRRVAVHALVASLLMGVLLLSLLILVPLLNGSVIYPVNLAALVFVITLGEVLLFQPARWAVAQLVDAVFFRRTRQWRRFLGELEGELNQLTRMDSLVVALTEEVPERLDLTGACLMVFDPLEPRQVDCFGALGEGASGRMASCRQAALRFRDEARRGEPLFVRELPSEEMQERLAPWRGAGAVLCLPLVQQRECVGLWFVGEPVDGALLGSLEVRLLARTARQVAPAVARAVLYEEVLGLARRLEKKVEERTRALTDLLARMAHALGTPVTSISGLADFMLVEAENLDPQSLEHLHFIQENVEQLLSLGRNMRMVAWLATGRLQPDLRSVDISQVVVQVAQEMRAEASARRVRMEMDLPAAKVCARGDLEYLYQIVRELVRNGLLYTPAGGVVRIAVQVGPEPAGNEGDGRGWVAVVVSDTGIGIPAEDRVRMYDPFFRGQHEVVRAQSGSGLGLAVVKGLVELQGGTIECESAVGEGATFTVVLRAADPDQEPPV